MYLVTTCTHLSTLAMRGLPLKILLFRPHQWRSKKMPRRKKKNREIFLQ